MLRWARNQTKGNFDWNQDLKKFSNHIEAIIAMIKKQKQKSYQRMQKYHCDQGRFHKKNADKSGDSPNRGGHP